MKPLFLMLACCIAVACKHKEPAPEENIAIAKDTTFRLVPPDTADDGIEDTGVTIINTENGDTLAYENNILDKILYYYPRLNCENYVIGPDESYADEGGNWQNFKEEDKNELSSFGSEAGQDEYYLLYGYYLKTKNTGAKEAVRRRKLVKIYRTINDIYAELNEGGTYFGHQYKRILAYAEYDIYNYINYSSADYKKDYDFTPQKKLFLLSLQQFIKDEAGADKGKPNTYKKQRINYILANVTKLDSTITGYFYLKNAQVFNFKYY